MKFTSEDLMKAMKLSVGDRIKLGNRIFEVYISPLDDIRCGNIHNANNHFNINKLIDQDYEILPRPKLVGDLKCDDFECPNCPLQYICNLRDYGFSLTNSLFNILELFNCDDQEIHDLLKARLDKEVEYNEI